jgi:hypothetical protein
MREGLDSKYPAPLCLSYWVFVLSSIKKLGNSMAGCPRSARGSHMHFCGVPGVQGGVTVTVAVPETVPLEACTVFGNVPVAVPAVNKPVVLLMVPPPATTDHVGVMATGLPEASFPAAVNCRVVPLVTKAGFGVTTIEANGPAMTVTVAVPVTPPLLAVTVLV